MKRFSVKEEPFYGAMNNRTPTTLRLREDKGGDFVHYSEHVKQVITILDLVLVAQEKNRQLSELLKKKEQEITSISDKLNNYLLSK